jgi:hypothetical protein
MDRAGDRAAGRPFVVRADAKQWTVGLFLWINAAAPRSAPRFGAFSALCAERCQ